MARFSLIPKDGRFFDDFILLAQELRKASRVLADMLTPDHPRWEAADELKALDEADRSGVASEQEVEAAFRSFRRQ